MKINLFWFRRDLRMEDNTALNAAMNAQNPVLPVFIFDEDILNELPESDARVSFIYDALHRMNITLQANQSSLLVLKGKPEKIWETICTNYPVDKVFVNRDYEPYALQRDRRVEEVLSKNGSQDGSRFWKLLDGKLEIAQDQGEIDRGMKEV